MSEEIKSTEVENTTEVESTESELLKSIKENPSKTETELLRLRAENKERRIKEGELSGNLKKIEDDKLIEQEKKLIEEGKFKELLEVSNKKIEDLTLQVTSLSDVKTKYDGIESRNKEILLTELEGLDQDMAELITNSTMETVDKIAKARKFKDQAKVIKTNPANQIANRTDTNDDTLTALGRKKMNVAHLVK